MTSRFVCTYDVPDNSPAQRTLSAPFATPLLQCALVAHAHVSAHVKNSIDGVFVAYRAFGAGGYCGTVLLCPAYGGWIGTRVWDRLKRKNRVVRNHDCKYDNAKFINYSDFMLFFHIYWKIETNSYLLLCIYETWVFKCFPACSHIKNFA